MPKFRRNRVFLIKKQGPHFLADLVMRFRSFALELGFFL